MCGGGSKRGRGSVGWWRVCRGEGVQYVCTHTRALYLVAEVSLSGGSTEPSQVDAHDTFKLWELSIEVKNGSRISGIFNDVAGEEGAA